MNHSPQAMEHMAHAIFCANSRHKRANGANAAIKFIQHWKNRQIILRHIDYANELMDDYLAIMMED